MVNFVKRTEDFRIQKGDIPLADAMIAWNTGVRGWNVDGQHGDGRVAVIPHPDTRDWQTFLDISMTDGACWSGWRQMPKAKRLAALMHVAWRLACMYGGDPMDIHRAFIVIPEYRNSLPNGFCLMEEE